MRSAKLPCETWRAGIDVLRAKELPSMREHADHIERLLEQHGPEAAMVTLQPHRCRLSALSTNGARLALGIALPPTER